LLYAICKTEILFQFFHFFVIRDFAAVFAEFLEEEFLRCFHLIFLRDVVAVFTNLTDKTNGYSMITLFCHERYYTQSMAELE
jgi:hypothetical protein